MNNTNVTPVRVPVGDQTTRRRAAAAVGKAYIGHPLWWLCLLIFTGLSGLLVESAWQSYRAQLEAGWTALPLGGALICLIFGVVFVPVVNAVTIYRARDLHYLDTGRARAAMVTKPDNRRHALDGDAQAHTFGAWTRDKGAGSILGEWVRDQVHAQVRSAHRDRPARYGQDVHQARHARRRPHRPRPRPRREQTPSRVGTASDQPDQLPV